MVDKFEVGEYYRFVGGSEMKEFRAFDGKFRKCTEKKDDATIVFKGSGNIYILCLNEWEKYEPTKFYRGRSSEMFADYPECKHDPDWVRPNSMLVIDDIVKKINNPFQYSITALSFKGKTATVVLKDGKMGKSTCAVDDVFDPFVGACVAYCDALFGGKERMKDFAGKQYEKCLKKKLKKGKTNERKENKTKKEVRKEIIEEICEHKD